MKKNYIFLSVLFSAVAIIFFVFSFVFKDTSKITSEFDNYFAFGMTVLSLVFSTIAIRVKP